MAKLKRAKTGVAVYLESLQRHDLWIKTYLHEATIAHVRLRLDDITKNYPLYEKNQWVVEMEDDNDAAVTRANVESLYFSVRPILEDKLEELSYNRAPKIESDKMAPTLRTKLPEIALTTFSGDIMKWSEFIECFNSLVHSNRTLTTIAKFQYLKHALKDAAAHAIESLDFTEENYEVARNILREKFNKPNRICEHHIKGFFNAKALDKPCPRRLMELLDTFNSHLRSLRTLHRPTEQWDDLIVFLITSKFDLETKEKWCEAAPVDKLATYNDIITFIKVRCTKLELLPTRSLTSTASLKSSSSAAPNQTQTTYSQSKQRRFHGSSNSYHVTSNGYYCVFCNRSSHSILRCFELLKLSTKDRREAVENGRFVSTVSNLVML